MICRERRVGGEGRWRLAWRWQSRLVGIALRATGTLLPSARELPLAPGATAQPHVLKRGQRQLRVNTRLLAKEQKAKENGCVGAVAGESGRPAQPRPRCRAQVAPIHTANRSSACPKTYLHLVV